MKKNSTLLLLIFLLLLFVLPRVLGLSLPYHQDEWKTARIVEISAEAASSLYHPPLTQLSYRAAEKLFGSAHLRLLPFLFSLASFLFLYLVMKRLVGRRAALFSLFLYTLSFYSLLASLMIDTDGALLPFFFLLSLYAYLHYRDEIDSTRRRFWCAFLLSSLLGGLMVKLSFIIVIAVFIIEHLLESKGKRGMRSILFSLAGGLLLVGCALIAMLALRAIYPAFQFVAMFEHALLYVHLSGRSYTQIVVQVIKALEYLSPLLLLPLFFLPRAELSKLRIFALYLVSSLIFYLLIFDFSHGALDKYLMVSIIPLAALSGTALSSLFSSTTLSLVSASLRGFLIAVALFALNFFSHSVLPLYPKEEWFTKVFSGEWNILTPFTGGSGPLGFYVSFLFIAIAFLFSALIVVLGKMRMITLHDTAIILISIGIIYNGIFIEELLYGAIRGSAPQVLRDSLLFIKQDASIKTVVTYNDSGAYELSRMGKYAGRFYAVPDYEASHRVRFANYHGHFLIVGMPRIYRGGYYEELLSQCVEVFKTRSREINATIYDC